MMMMILMTIVMKIEHGCMHHDVDLPARTQGLEEAVYKPAESKKGLISPKNLYLKKIFGKHFFYIELIFLSRFVMMSKS